MSARYRESLLRAGYILRRGIPVPVTANLMFFFSLKPLESRTAGHLGKESCTRLALYE
jgi:hypothetical protein